MKAWLADHASSTAVTTVAPAIRGVGTPQRMPQQNSTDINFKLRMGFGGLPAHPEHAREQTEYTEFYVVVATDKTKGDGKARSFVVWSLQGTADQELCNENLLGCRASPCPQSESQPAGAFKINLAHAGTFYCVPLATQSTDELVDYLNDCGGNGRTLPLGRLPRGTSAPLESGSGSPAAFEAGERFENGSFA